VREEDKTYICAEMWPFPPTLRVDTPLTSLEEKICEVTAMAHIQPMESHDTTRAPTLNQKKQKPRTLRTAVRAVAQVPAVRLLKIIRGYCPM